MSRIYSKNNVKTGGKDFAVFRGSSGTPRTGAVKDVGSIGGTSLVSELVTWNPGSFYKYTPDSVDQVPQIVTGQAGAGKGLFVAKYKTHFNFQRGQHENIPHTHPARRRHRDGNSHPGC